MYLGWLPERSARNSRGGRWGLHEEMMVEVGAARGDDGGGGGCTLQGDRGSKRDATALVADKTPLFCQRIERGGERVFGLCPGGEKGLSCVVVLQGGALSRQAMLSCQSSLPWYPDLPGPRDSSRSTWPGHGELISFTVPPLGSKAASHFLQIYGDSSRARAMSRPMHRETEMSDQSRKRLLNGSRRLAEVSVFPSVRCLRRSVCVPEIPSLRRPTP
ncbi:hypothetical protein NQZ68_001274 [Dissostichus eleginoides]|nr:hypothetical protein NQZ68_001274 [Dissostichus eleginoides]